MSSYTYVHSYLPLVVGVGLFSAVCLAVAYAYQIGKDAGMDVQLDGWSMVPDKDYREFAYFRRVTNWSEGDSVGHAFRCFLLEADKGREQAEAQVRELEVSCNLWHEIAIEANARADKAEDDKAAILDAWDKSLVRMPGQSSWGHLSPLAGAQSEGLWTISTTSLD